MSRSRAGLSLRLVALAVLLTGFPSASAAQMVPLRESAYWDIVSEYAGRGRERALTAIAGLSARDLESITRAVSDLSKAAQRCQNCAARTEFDALPLRAALLLHGEGDRRVRLSRVRAAGGNPDCTIEAHGRMTERLLWLAERQPGGPEFLARFAALTSLHYRALLCFGPAKLWVDAGLGWAPGDAQLLLFRGLLHEALGTMVGAPGTLVAGTDLKGHFSGIPEFGSADLQLKRAVSAYEKALAADPQVAEAYLRLGRVRWRLKRFPEARDSLNQAVAKSEGHALYLAHLFRGRVLEDEGDLEAAISDYAASLPLEPESQIAAVALAYALSVRGDAGRAREVLEGALAVGKKGKGVDLYWNYLVGNPAAPEVFFNTLRVQTLR